MSTPLEQLVDLLDLERIEADIFRGRSPEGQRQRVFGGQIASQALVAVGRTVPEDRPVHSMHAYFIVEGDPAVPLVYLVQRVRDGRSFSTRRVSAVQHGRTIFALSASFHRDEPGVEHAHRMPDVPAPETISPTAERVEKLLGPSGLEVYQKNSFDIRNVGPLPFEARCDPALRTTRNLVWLRANGELPADPLLHACVMTYASGMNLFDTVLLAHGLSWEDRGIRAGLLDYAMWFHRRFRADRWLLYAQDSPVASGARGLARGEVYTSDGALVVSVALEGLIRVSEPPAD